MSVFETLYTFSTLVAIVACIPQMRQLMNTKRSDEFNLFTWSLWFGTQIISFAYVSSLGEGLLAVASLSWALFYMGMVGLIIYYRRPAHLLRLAEQEAADY